MGVPITFFDKYNPDQFEIVAFRKGEDGKDLVFTREREREFNRISVSLFDGNSGAYKELGRKKTRKDNVCKNDYMKEAKEPIDMFYPLSVKGRAAGSMNGTINGKETYRRMLIRRKSEEYEYRT